MPYYTYKSLLNEGAKFELQQSIHDAPFAQHPETGEPIKKTIESSPAIRIVGLKRSTVVNKSSPAATACGCAADALLSHKNKTPNVQESQKKHASRPKNHHHPHSTQGNCC